MGNLLRLLTSREDSSRDSENIFVDFENVQPTPEEKELWDQVKTILDEGDLVLRNVQSYDGAAESIRQAISNPNNEEFQEKAWQCVCPLVKKLKEFYDFSVKLSTTVPDLLLVLCSNDRTPMQHLETQQALFKQFADILHFVLKFDDLKSYLPCQQVSYVFSILTQTNDIIITYWVLTIVEDLTSTSNNGTQNTGVSAVPLKDLQVHTSEFFSMMSNPAIQNDFSYYRRTLSRQKLANEEEVAENENILSNEVANRMSLFYANATPMLNVLSEATTRFVTSHKDIPVENTTDCLSKMAKICREMTENPELNKRFENPEKKLFCLRVMVGVIILYDHVHHIGAFAKGSLIDMKGSIKVLKEQDSSRVEGLLNALRYTTKHLNDETTPKSIKNMLSDA